MDVGSVPWNGDITYSCIFLNTLIKSFLEFQKARRIRIHMTLLFTSELPAPVGWVFLPLGVTPRPPAGIGTLLLQQ